MKLRASYCNYDFAIFPGLDRTQNSSKLGLLFTLHATEQPKPNMKTAQFQKEINAELQNSYLA